MDGKNFFIGIFGGQIVDAFLRSIMLVLSMPNTKEVYVEGISSSVKAICNSILEQILI
jgi:hypothetical protein